MLSGQLPYGEALTRHNLNRLEYRPLHRTNPNVPVWLDGALAKAVQKNPDLRYNSLSEFQQDLKTPNKKFTQAHAKPLIERNPLLFWQSAALLFLLLNLIQGIWHLI